MLITWAALFIIGIWVFMLRQDAIGREQSALVWQVARKLLNNQQKARHL